MPAIPRSPGPLTPGNQRQMFHFGPARFDVEKAHSLIAADPRPQRPVDVFGWAHTYGITISPKPLKTAIHLGPDFDPEYALTVDLSRPVIVATLRTMPDMEIPVLIDGCHRLYRAAIEGRSLLPGYLLSVEETGRILTLT